MTQTLTLSQLGKQYLDESERVDKQLNDCCQRLKIALKHSRSDEVIKLRRLMRIYYEQRSELRLTGKLLSSYYN